MEQEMFMFFCLMLLASVSSVECIKSIFLLAGQSNMVGLGGVVNGTWDGVVPPESQASPLILRLNANDTWEEAREPLHQGLDANVPSCGIGPGMPFSNSILKRDPTVRVIGLVPCAYGASNISQWRRGSPLYNRLVTRAKAAALNGGGLIRAMLWYQGESDAFNQDNAELYKQRLVEFFNDVRADLLSPLLPVIQVALAATNGPYVETIRKAQLETAIPFVVRCVDGKGLPLQPDGLHLTTAGQVKLGTMLADAFLRKV